MKRIALKRITALLLSLVMTLSVCPVTALAEEQLHTDEQEYIVENETENVPEEETTAVEEIANTNLEKLEKGINDENLFASETATVSSPLAYSSFSAQACWGLATGENNDQAPTIWVGNGNLTDAVDYANKLTSGTAYIQLLSDVDTTAPIEFAKNTKTILDLNSFDVDRGLAAAASDGYVIKVRGILTLCDTSESAITAPGKITGGYADSCGGVYVSSDGFFTMNSGAISENATSSGGGGVYVIGGTFTMNGGSIFRNTADLDGGGVCVWTGTFNMNGGLIGDNVSSRNGGGIYVNSYGTFIMSDGNIYENNAASGGGVYTYGSFLMSNGIISENSAADYGGGVRTNDNGSFTMIGGNVVGNDSNCGGGVYVGSGFFAMSGGFISGNTANNKRYYSNGLGGGVYVSYGTMKVSGIPYISGNVLNGTLNSETGLYELGEGGLKSNVYFSSDQTISVVDTLNVGAVIGVTPYKAPTNTTPVTVAVSGDSSYIITKSDAAKFVGDDGSFSALDSINNVVQLKQAKASLSGSGVVCAGSDVTLLLNVSGSGITGMEGTLEYDNATLELVNYKNVATGWDLNQTGTKYTMTGEDAPVISEIGVLALIFRVKANALVDTQINVSFKDLVLSDGNNDFDIGTVSWSGTVDRVSTATALTGPSIVSAGSEVTLTLNVSCDNTKHIETTLDYDTGVLELVSHRSSLPDDWTVVKEGLDFIFSSDVRPINSYAEVLTVTLLVKRNAPVEAVLSAAFADITLFDGETTSNIGAAIWHATVNNATEARWGLATGTNNNQPPTEWIDSGTLVEATYYANEIPSGVAYIQLLIDVDTTAPLIFANGKSTVLDLNGKIIDRGLTKATYNGSVIFVSGNLTLCDTSENAAVFPGKIRGGYTEDKANNVASGGGVRVSGSPKAASFIMNGGEISGNIASYGGGGVYIDYDETFIMNGGIISNNYGYSGGGVLARGNFTMNEGLIAENTAEYAGGGMECYEFTMKGGSVSNNTARVAGGVYAGSDIFIMTGGTISGNSATHGAGGVLSYVTFVMTGGSITGNNTYGEDTAWLGGGIEAYGTMEVWGCPKISGNVINGIFNEETGLYELGTNGLTSNVFLFDCIISVSGKLNDDTSIGVKTYRRYDDTSSHIVATGRKTNPTYTLTEDDAAKFTSDNGYLIEYDSTNNQVLLTARKITKGDVNLDGEVNADDLTALARHVAKIEALTDSYALQSADVDNNGSLSADDLTKLARYVAKIIPSL